MIILIPIVTLNFLYYGPITIYHLYDFKLNRMKVHFCNDSSIIVYRMKSNVAAKYPSLHGSEAKKESGVKTGKQHE